MLRFPQNVLPFALRKNTRQFRNMTPVTGSDGNVAVGRLVICIGLSVHGQYELKGSAVIDSSGNYHIDVVGAGANDRCILVAIGRNDIDEYTRALGNMTAVPI